MGVALALPGLSAFFILHSAFALGWLPHGRKRGEQGAVGLWTNALHHFSFSLALTSPAARTAICSETSF